MSARTVKMYVGLLSISITISKQRRHTKLQVYLLATSARISATRASRDSEWRTLRICLSAAKRHVTYYRSSGYCGTKTFPLKMHYGGGG